MTSLTGKVLCHELARVADWYQRDNLAVPPTAVVRAIEATTDLVDFPILNAVVSCLAVIPPGEIVLVPATTNTHIFGINPTGTLRCRPYPLPPLRTRSVPPEILSTTTY